jgi:hypothetical protein
MRRPIHPTRRFTGWQAVFGLRRDMYGLGYESQYVLGCLDAPTAMPSGSVVEVFDTNHPPLRFASERGVLREGC